MLSLGCFNNPISWPHIPNFTPLSVDHCNVTYYFVYSSNLLPCCCLSDDFKASISSLALSKRQPACSYTHSWPFQSCIVLHSLECWIQPLSETIWPVDSGSSPCSSVPRLSPSKDFHDATSLSDWFCVHPLNEILLNGLTANPSLIYNLLVYFTNLLPPWESWVNS